MKYKNHVRIEEDYVVKKKNDKLIELFNYLDSVSFNNYPKIIEVTDNEIKTEYIKETKHNELTEGIELIQTMASLHKKTVKFKEISRNKYKEVSNKIINNIEYLKEYYEELIDDIETEEYMSPSHYLFARNYSVIMATLSYTTKEIKKWYKLVENKTSERVTIVHNNISFDHFIQGENNYLISFDNYLVDTPILDIYKFYKKDGLKCDFLYLFNEYNRIFTLLPEEIMLLKILISIPPKIEFVDNELLNTTYITDTFKYIYSSYKFINS